MPLSRRRLLRERAFRALRREILRAHDRRGSQRTEIIFKEIPFPPEETALIIDPPRKGCGADFIAQMLAFAPRRVVYVSCAPDTQARDLQTVLESGKYALEAVQPFDLFPQTRHIENIAVLAKK